MRVYRCISAREILSKYKDIPVRSAIAKGENTHVYEKGISYLHFFRYSEFAEYYFEIQRKSVIDVVDSYVLFLVANIPNEILEKYSGYGFYGYPTELLYEKEGDSNCRIKKIPIPEYAIPVSCFKQDYVVDISDKINFLYKSKENEFQKYLNLIIELSKEFDGCEQLSSFLLDHELPALLDVIDEKRSEEEMEHDAIVLATKYLPIIKSINYDDEIIDACKVKQKTLYDI